MTREGAVRLRSMVERCAATAAALGLIAGAYLTLARPAQLRWGASDAEVARAMPGDALSDHPTFLSTRAISIAAPPEAIWPWLVQLGYGRAGFYGYDILENIGSPRGLRSADRIIPELQQLAVGDPLPLSAAGGLIVNAIEPPRFLIWSGAEGAYPGAFTWALYPIDATHTRLISRIQWTHHVNPPHLAALDIFTDLTDHLAVRKILHGVKDRAEGHAESFGWQTFEFAVLVWALGAFAMALWRCLRRLTWGRWLAAVLSGAVWLVVWYAPIGVWPAIVLNLALAWVLGRRGGPRVMRARALVPAAP
jgi:hypothetical protein